MVASRYEFGILLTGESNPACCMVRRISCFCWICLVYLKLLYVYFRECSALVDKYKPEFEQKNGSFRTAEQNFQQCDFGIREHRG